MTTYVLSGVAFAKSTLPNYVIGLRVLVEATVNLDATFITNLNAQTGGPYSATAPVTTVTYTRLDTGEVLGTVASPGNVTVSVLTLQRTAVDSQRLIKAQIPDYEGGTPNFAGTAFCSKFTAIGDAVIATGGAAYPVDLGDPGGFLGRYYNNLDLIGQPVKQIQEAINFSIPRDTQIFPEVTDDFSARWTGAVKPSNTGAHRFALSSDDGCRLWINGTLLIDSWVGVAGWRESGTVELVADTPATIWVEFFDRGADAQCRLYWLHPGVSEWTLVPSARSYPGDGSDAIPAEVRPTQQAFHDVEEIQRY